MHIAFAGPCLGMLHLALPTDTSGAHTHFNVKLACAGKRACLTESDMSLTCDSLHGHIPSRPWNVELLCRVHVSRVALPRTCWTQGQSVEDLVHGPSPCRPMASPFSKVPSFSNRNSKKRTQRVKK
jgi:hypothetical protein